MTFHFDIGGFDASTTEIRLKRHHLHIYEYFGIKPADQKPLLVNIKKNPDWLSLVAYLNRCKWNAEYLTDVCDGTQWTLKVSTDRVKFSCYGSNAYPKGFNMFLRKLNKITVVVNISLV